jgi:hypothetical protein
VKLLQGSDKPPGKIVHRAEVVFPHMLVGCVLFRGDEGLEILSGLDPVLVE